MSDLRLPRKAYSLKEGEHEIDSYRYIVLISKDKDEKVSILLYEEKLLKDYDFTNTFAPTGNGNTFTIDDVIEFYRLYRISYLENITFWNSFENREKLKLSADDIKELEKKNFDTLKQWYKNPIFISDKETRKYRKLFISSPFDYYYTLGKIENLFTNDFFNKMSLTDFEINISNYLEANFDVEYLPQNKETKLFATLSDKTDFSCKYVCKNIYDVFFAVLHYCKLHGYKIKMCKLCHSLFIAENLKENYCYYPFSYTDWENKTHTYPQCAGKTGARKKINDKLMCRKKNVYQWLYRRYEEYGMLEGDKSKKDFYDFEAKCKEYEKQIKENPCIDNFKEYEKYLYMDCDKIYRKYERRR